MQALSMNRWRTLLGIGGVLGVMVGPQIARAQLEPTVTKKPGEEHIRSGFGVSIQGGGGVTDFTGGTERDLTHVGGSWDVRAVFGTRKILGFEAAYVGSAHSLSTAFNTGTDLISNGLEGNIRLNVPVVQNGVLIEPFGFVGVGWSNYYLTNYVNTNSDDVGTVPMGAGLAIGYRGFLAEARLTYRPTFGENELIVTSDNRTLGFDNWNLGLMLGFEF